ncbi:MAG: ABC transporter permease [Candidatus Accumulibacter meliphilus]|jgi:lipopolysaccharide transport system permease protein|uniref:ABC transporter permease n=1 Tax=Candidatus Accumulibacter meliphilus TaxID=2211374 RepID=UPI002FC2C8A2
MTKHNLLSSLVAYRYLIGQLVRREVILKYRGAVLGIGWSFLYPLLLLGVFTLVFGGVFGGRWGAGGKPTSGGLEMALFIYCGLTIFSPLSEVAIATPKLLLANQNFIKKIIFPTEVLPIVAVLAAAIHGAANLLLLQLAALAAGHAHLSALLTPILLLPAGLFMLGIGWFLTATGAYVRDLAHGMPILMQMLMFALPVFYPANSAPQLLHALNQVNPFAIAIEDLRRAVLYGLAPAWSTWWVTLALGGLFCVLGYRFFMYCQEEFADVL